MKSLVRKGGNWGFSSARGETRSLDSEIEGDANTTRLSCVAQY